MRALFKTLLLLIVPFCITCSFAVQTFAEESIKIAVMLAHTGAAAKSDAYGWEGAQLAAEHINSQGGILGRQLEVVLLDTQSTPIGATKAAKKAVQENVAGVVGANWSSQSLAIAKIMQKTKTPMITPSSTHPDVTRIGDYIFRMVFTDTFQGNALAKFAYEDLRASTAVVLRNISETYSMNLAKTFTSSFNAYGGEILWQGDYKTNTSDFTDLLEMVRIVEPQVVFVPGYERDCGILLRQAGSLGLTIRFLGGDGWARSILEVAGAAANGSFYLSQWHHESPEPLSKKLVGLFRERYPELAYPPKIFPMTYNAVFLMVDSIKRAGTVDRKAIQKALSQTKGYKTVTGSLTFDANGDPVESTAAILKIADNDIQFFKTIRFP